MNSSVIKDWLELPEAVLVPIDIDNCFEPVLHPAIQPLAVPCLWNLHIR